MRLYVPTTVAGLAGFVAAGRMEGIEPVIALSDSEEDEYAAMLDAADQSQSQLRSPGRRVVVVAEPSRESAGTEISDDVEISWTDVVAVHADTEDIAPGADEVPELAWFAPQETDQLLD